MSASLARVASRAQLGLAAPPVDVEVHLGTGLPLFSIVGLPATAVKESKERVRAALVNSGFDFPAGRITVNLSPADLPKEGCRYDLPIALGILIASGQLTTAEAASDIEYYGELGLGGELKPVRGLLLAAVAADRAAHAVVVPQSNLAEVSIAAVQRVCGAPDLSAVCGVAAGHVPVRVGAHAAVAVESANVASSPRPDLADVRGQAAAKRALVIAAAGQHSLLLIGPPGTGKSMLAQRLPGLLPPLARDAALDVAGIASVSAEGFDVRRYGVRPFRTPHHTASANAIIGGGPRAQPGEVSLAHHGVLFLDELPEFDRRVLESLREPLECGVVSIARTAFRVEYPASVQLVAAMNPCPCGYLGDSSGRCRCAPPQIARYRARVSGPLLDRIDLRVEVPRVADDELLDALPLEGVLCTAQASRRVAAARARQQHRAQKPNALLTPRDLATHCTLDRACRQLVGVARARLALSARGVHRVLRVARTIADLDAAASIAPAHLAEAIQLRREIVC
ncbi:MAG TPA: YifB family Mg chelatase-like AAA ATPase [Steroidobacteraceae bacterium]|nr:YifB family Mg chelatase-like AAA ATPase [Steroidobacteraceae bacterium]HRX88603.1 YifB family Mg chelatase-like AAA ATPase [Steroidobacteraceae bacterium]